MDNRKEIKQALEKHISDVWGTESPDVDDQSKDFFLDHLFVHLPTFEGLFEHKRFLIKSRKGTGKTSLKRYYKSRAVKDGIIPIELNFSSIFDSDFFDRLNNHEDYRQRFRKFSELIQFTLLVEIGREVSIVCGGGYSQELFMELSKKRLPRILSESSSIDIDWNCAIKSGPVLASFFNAEVALSSVKKVNGTEIVSIEYGKLIEPIKDEIRMIAKDRRISFIIDDTDKDWFNYRDVYTNFISSFIGVVSDINEQFNYGKSGPKIILLVRSDLFEAIRHLPQGNLAKIIEDKMIEINWGKNEKYLDIVKKRLLYIKEVERIEGIPSTFHDLVRFYFPKKTDHVLNHYVHSELLNWTYLRPRDIIILSKKIIESDGNESILKNIYGTWFRTETLTDEFYGYLENQKEAISILNTLSASFSYQQFTKAFRGFEVELQDGGKSADDLLRYFLFQSYVGVMETVPSEYFKTTPSSNYHYAYREFGKIPEYDKKTSNFVFHEGFKMALRNSS